jgi:LytS/YehU family sensor histidine kinase
LLFWGIFLLFSTSLATLNSGSFKYHLIKYLSLLPSQMIAAYCLAYFQIPTFLLKKKYISFFISFLVFGYLFSAIARLSVVHIAEPFIRENFEQESFIEILKDVYYLFAVYFPTVYSVAFIMVISQIVKKRFEEKQQIEILQKEKAANELKFLRAQIQPHFLFNTLNNLYALTLAKSDLAPQIVLKLSEMLDFILYQSDQPSIPVEKEIELIEGFIDLETLRFGETLDVTFNHTIENKTAQISPLLLLPFVENAFKHGLAGNLENPTIKIDLKVADEKLTFEICNNKPEVIAEEKKNISGGIGTKNLARQLELNYQGKYELQVDDQPESYKVTLTIDLK